MSCHSVIYKNQQNHSYALNCTQSCMMSIQIESSWLRLNKVEVLGENSDKKSRQDAAWKADEAIFLCAGEHMFGVACLNSSLERAHSQRSVKPATTASKEPQ